MNYRHAFHAGNHADVVKHWTLLLILEALKRKPAPFAVIETHAGRGLYGLASEEAQRSPEWREGAARVADWADAPEALQAYRAALLAVNPDNAMSVYPGSPALVRGALREGDRYAGCELHPVEAAALKAALGGDRRMHLHARDGWEALGALLPPPERRGLVIIDPPYEAAGELARSARAIASSLQRFRNGIYLWWRPLKDKGEVARADAELATLGAPGWLRLDLRVRSDGIAPGLPASSVLVVNPPFGLRAAWESAAHALAARLAQGPGAAAEISVTGAI